MKKILFFYFLCLGYSVFAQYQIGNTKITFKDNTRGNRNILTFIYYPASTGGTDVPIAPDAAKFPVISFGHGFVMSSLAYQWIAEALVPYGYIIGFPSTEEGVPPNHSDFGKDEAFVARSLRNLGDSVNSFLYNRTNGYSAIGGHSMGGGATFLGMQNVTDITTFFNFSAAETFLTESAVQTAKLCSQPALVFTGTKDCVAPPAGNSRFMYNNLISSYKFFANIHDASHCQFGDPNKTPCEVGEAAACSGRVYISAAEQQRRVLLLLKPWLDFWIKRDCAALSTFYSNISGAINDIDTLQSKIMDCTAIDIPNALQQHKTIKALIFPNPSKGRFSMQISEIYSEAVVTLLDVKGSIINCKIIKGQKNIPLDYSNLPGGAYQIVVDTDRGSFTSTIVISQ